MSVLQKATQVLDCLGSAELPLRLGVIATAVELPKSSTHRLLAELASLGIVRRDEAGYTLGPRLLYWGAGASASFDLRGYAEGPMRRLRDELGESVHLYVADNGNRVCIAAVESHHSLRPFVALGRPTALGVGSSGRVLLAFSPENSRGAGIAELERLGEGYIPTISELDRIRQTHWAASPGEREDGLVSAATTVRGPDGRVLAALTVSGPALRLTPQLLADLGGPMMACAAEITALLASDLEGDRAPAAVGSR